MSRSHSLLGCVCVLAAAALVASCATATRQTQYNRAAYVANAGQPIDRFQWVAGYRRWTAISANQVVVWTRLNRAYLVTAAQPCQNLYFARAIGFTHTGDSVYARSNAVKADGWTCLIKTIQPIDNAGLQRDMRRQSQADASSGGAGG